MSREEEKERHEQEEHDAELRGEALMATRMVHAGMASLMTFGIAMLIGMHDDTAKEISLLNGGIAYFEAELGDRISLTIRRVFKR